MYTAYIMINGYFLHQINIGLLSKYVFSAFSGNFRFRMHYYLTELKKSAELSEMRSMTIN